ncbi:MAG: hypothetical protein JO199_10935 [Candidatus Eremiobacteraeota bacterium]|nr:hypothetical protein [Candidatus Eremiobacteraeota bacterium]
MKTTLPYAALVVALLGVAAPPPAGTPIKLHPLGSPTPNAIYMENHERIVYGTVSKIESKSAIVVKLRNGYPQRVDMTEVLRTGRYSAPIFIGKIVAVTGRIEPATGALRASTLVRATKLPQMKEEPDRWVVPVPTAKP